LCYSRTANWSSGGARGRLVGPGDFLLARYLPDGSLDTTSGTGGRAITDFGGNDGASALVLQPDGKLVAAGTAHAGSFSGDFGLARYDPDGNLDPAFGTGGKVTTDFFFGSADSANALVLQPDGRLLAAGFALSSPSGPPQFGLARCNPDGSLDASFGSFGTVTTDFGVDAFANALVLQPDGRLVAAGGASGASGIGFAFARCLPRAGGTCVVSTLAALPEVRVAAPDTADRSDRAPAPRLPSPTARGADGWTPG
jgi:uncharacterized delta-60 repeat protein